MLTKFPSHKIKASRPAKSPAVAEFSKQKLPLESIKYEKVWDTFTGREERTNRSNIMFGRRQVLYRTNFKKAL